MLLARMMLVMLLLAALLISGCGEMLPVAKNP